ncbi:hypothetical protein [Marinifilum caeruleilacunae]|uniref:Uncharacterized protein n=1 Tax=Marinifilum caeruleilacunae TaxID=2499076 RepID=A0ABX1WZU1_9BACT|nr:hypothetical protein [Marinifilum caeruleilacunae]NOU61355.1 hypothetical protein [Marinifilum caeruleilacunae]
MKKKILSLMFFGVLLIAAAPKKADAACIDVNLSCYDGYMVCGLTMETVLEGIASAEEDLCD